MPPPPTSARPSGRGDRGGRHRPRALAAGAGPADGWGDGADAGRRGDEADRRGDQESRRGDEGDRRGDQEGRWGAEVDRRGDQEEGRGDEAVDQWDDEFFELPADEPHRRVPLVTVPESLRSVDVRVGPRAVRGLLLLALVVVLVLGGRWWWVQQGAGAVPVGELAPLAGEAVGTDPQMTTSPVAPQEISQESGTAGADVSAPVVVSVVVHVVGEVRSPGVVELPAGARVADAVAAAGGLTEAADQASLNLARTLVDGEQVWVGAPGEEPPVGVARGNGSGGSGSGAGGQSSGGGPGAPPAPLDLNLATQAELEELPGVGPVTAGRVLAWREEHGRFSSVQELMEVSGIGERTFAQLEPLVTVGG